MPFFVVSRDNDVAMDASAVFAAGSNHYPLSSPLQILARPTITVERGTLILPKQQNGNDGAAMLSRLAQGVAVLTISDAVISVAFDGAQMQPQSTEVVVAPLAAALKKFRLKSLLIKNSKIRFVSDGGAGYVFEAVDARIDVGAWADVKAHGSFYYRHQPLSFEVGFDLTQKNPSVAAVPVDAVIKGKIGEAQLKGQLIREARLQLIADETRLSTKNLSEALRWFGVPWPQSHKLGPFKAQGKLDWTGESITFQETQFDVGGNAASGTLSIGFEKFRPLIEGTLAFKTLNLAQYYVARGPDKAASPAARSRGWLERIGVLPQDGVVSKDGDVTAALRTFDADLRASAESVVVGDVKVANSAATLSLKEGKLLVDLAELGLGPEGRGDVQVSVNVNGSAPAYGIRGRLKDTDIGPVFKLLFEDEFLKGPADVKIDVTGSGVTRYDFMQSLSGDVAIKLVTGGVMALDIVALMDAKRSGTSAPGWGKAKNGTTKLEDVDLSVAIEDGVAKAENISARAAQRRLRAEGTIELHSKALDLLIEAYEPDEANGRVKQVFGLHARGSWKAPHIVPRDHADSGTTLDRSLVPNGAL